MIKYLVAVIASAALLFPSTGSAWWLYEYQGRGGLYLSADDIIYDLPAALVMTVVKHDSMLRQALMNDPWAFSEKIAALFPHVDIMRSMEYAQYFCSENKNIGLGRNREIADWIGRLYSLPLDSKDPFGRVTRLIEMAYNDSAWLFAIMDACPYDGSPDSPMFAVAADVERDFESPIFLPFGTLENFGEYFLLGDIAWNLSIFDRVNRGTFSYADTQIYGFEQAMSLDILAHLYEYGFNGDMLRTLVDMPDTSSLDPLELRARQYLGSVEARALIPLFQLHRIQVVADPEALWETEHGWQRLPLYYDVRITPGTATASPVDVTIAVRDDFYIYDFVVECQDDPCNAYVDDVVYKSYAEVRFTVYPSLELGPNDFGQGILSTIKIAPSFAMYWGSP